jgi:hypothetical protein
MGFFYRRNFYEIISKHCKPLIKTQLVKRLRSGLDSDQSDQKEFGFIILNDGTTQTSIQVYMTKIQHFDDVKKFRVVAVSPFKRSHSYPEASNL